MSIGYGISALTDGFFKGRQYRDEKEEKAYNRKRQERMDALQEKYDNLRIQELGLSIEDKKRTRAQEDAIDAANAENARLYGEGLQGITNRGLTPADPQTYMVPGAYGNDGYTLGVTPQAASAAQPPAQPAPARTSLGFGAMGAVPVVQGGGGSTVVSGGAGNDTLTAPVAGGPSFETYGREVGNASISDQAAAARIKNEVASGNAKPKQVTTAPVAPEIAAAEAALSGQVQEALRRYQPNPDHQFFQPGGLGADVREGINRIGGAVADDVKGTAQRAAGVAATAANAVNTVINPYVEYATGYKFPMAGQQAQPSPAFEASGRGGNPAVTAANTSAATAAPKTPAEQVATEGTKQAVEAVKLSFGLKPAESYTQAQVKSAAKAATQLFNEQIAPRVIQQKIAAGDYAGAQGLVEYLETVEAKESMNELNAAIFMYSQGDIDGFAKAGVKLANRYGAGTGIEVDEAATKNNYDENGNFVSSTVVYKDTKSGNTFTQVFTDPQEAYDYLVYSYNPISTYERMQAAQADQKGVISPDKASDLAIKLMEMTEQRRMTDPSVQSLTYEQALATVMGGGLGTVGASQGLDPRVKGVGPDGEYHINDDQ